jgi:hypothetical protein
MRLLIGFMVVLATVVALQSVHPECPGSHMTGVEWVGCLIR